MLHILHEVEDKLPQLLSDLSKWNSVDITYHPPRVERLWMQYGDNRIYLHRIHPCNSEEALLHPHPWPSAMRIVQGTYEMGMGYSATNDAPPIIGKMFLPAGAEYEMTEMNGWHYVRPVRAKVYTLMVTGIPWKRESPKSTEPLIRLKERVKGEIVTTFLEHYD